LNKNPFGHPILLQSLQVTQPTYPLPLYSFCYNFSYNPLKTKRRLRYLKTQSVPRCKHFSSRL
jgi:hypothetical protein